MQLKFILFMSACLRKKLFVFLLGLLVLQGCQLEKTQTSSSLPAPNILLLVAEDMSLRVGAFGDSVANTPALDQLASQGVRYPNVFTTAGVCAPSRASLITGAYQISIGGQHMRTKTRSEGAYFAVPPKNVKAFPELLRREGYFTFTDFKLDYQFSHPQDHSGPFTIWDQEGSSTLKLLWQNRTKGQPFFGMINFMATHESGLFSALEQGQKPRSKIHAYMLAMRQKLFGDIPHVTDPNTVKVPPYYPDTVTVRTDIAQHYDNIHFMDKQVAQILARLKADGLDESTIVIWTTDHGDGLPRAKRELFDSGIKVPMIVYWPPKYKPSWVKEGSLDKRMISFVDLAPTIMALAGIQAADHMLGQNVLAEAAKPHQYVYAARDRIDNIYDRQRSVRDKQYKYIRSWHPEQAGGHHLDFRDNLAMVREMYKMLDDGELNAEQRQWFEAPGAERLFDLNSDPHELVNLISNPKYTAVLKRFRGVYQSWANQVPDWSDRHEGDMVESFAPNGERAKTAVVTISEANDKLLLHSKTEGASIGYQINKGNWQLYNVPINLQQGQTLNTKAVRYGWQESDETHFSYKQAL